MGIESQGTTIEIGTGSGGALTITDISLANPTLLTDVAHGLSDGDVVAAADFAGVDAGDINGNEYVVMFVTDDTFAIGLDSTDLTITDNTDTATMTPVTWSEIGEVTDFSGPDGSASEIDMTHLTSTAKEFIMGLPDEGSLSMSVNWDTSDAGQAAARAARVARTEQDFKITYSDASTATFTGYVLALSSSGGVDNKIDGSLSIRISAAITWA